METSEKVELFKKAIMMELPDVRNKVEQFKKSLIANVLSEFNQYHGTDGRFSNASGAVGKGAPTKGGAKTTTKKKAAKETPAKGKGGGGGVVAPKESEPKTTKGAGTEVKHEGKVHDDFAGADIEGAPTNFNKYTMSNGSTVLVDGSVKDHKAAAQKFAQSTSSAPAEHSALIQTAVITNKGMALPFGQGTDNDIYARARYKKGKVTMYNGSVNNPKAKGIVTHEIGHLTAGTSTGRKGFNTSFKRDKKDVTLYGTKRNLEEAFAESYSKFHITGKVTGIGGKTAMTSTTAWFNKNHGKSRGKASGSSSLLYEAQRKRESGLKVVVIGGYKIEAKYNKKGEIIEERFTPISKKTTKEVQ